MSCEFIASREAFRNTFCQIERKSVKNFSNEITRSSVRQNGHNKIIRARHRRKSPTENKRGKNMRKKCAKNMKIIGKVKRQRRGFSCMTTKARREQVVEETRFTRPSFFVAFVQRVQLVSTFCT